MTARLTPRELAVLEHAADGLTVKETAARLGISPLTVRAHRAMIMRKLDVPNIVAAAVALERDRKPAA